MNVYPKILHWSKIPIRKIAYLKLKHKNNVKIVFIQVYAPTTVASTNELDKFYALVNNTVKKVK